MCGRPGIAVRARNQASGTGRRGPRGVTRARQAGKRDRHGTVPAFGSAAIDRDIPIPPREGPPRYGPRSIALTTYATHAARDRPRRLTRLSDPLRQEITAMMTTFSDPFE